MCERKSLHVHGHPCIVRVLNVKQQVKLLESLIINNFATGAAALD